MKRCKRSPERAFRPQAGVKPLQEIAITLALKGRQDALSPLLGWGTSSYLQGGTLTMVFSCLRILGWETSIN